MLSCTGALRCGLSIPDALVSQGRLWKKGYGAVLDREGAGLGRTVFVEIKVERHSRENAQVLQDAHAAMPEVVSCHMVSGTADFLAEVVVADLRAYEALLTERPIVLPMVADIRSNISLRRVNSDAPLPLPGVLTPLGCVTEVSGGGCP